MQPSRAIIWHGFQAITTGFLFPILMPVTLTYSRSYLMFDPRLQLGDGGFQGTMGGRQMMALAPPIRWRHSHRPRFNLKLTDQHKQQIMDAVLRNAKVQE